MNTVEFFKKIKLKYYLLVLAFSFVVTWIATMLAVLEYIQKSGGVIDELGGYLNLAVSTIDLPVLVFSVGLFLLAGLITAIISTISKLKQLSVVISIWCCLIVTGVVVAKVLS